MNTPTQADDRIPLRFAAVANAAPHEALLIEEPCDDAPPADRAVARFRAGPGARPAHFAGCPCCTGRGAAASALGALLRDRALGRVAWFTAIVAVVRDPRAMAEELRGDRLAAARVQVQL